MTRHQIALTIALALLLVGLPRAAEAFRYADVGAALPNATLTALDGHRQPILDQQAKLNLFVFFRPNQPRSLDAVTILASVCEDYAPRNVRCVAIVSDYYPRKDVLQAIGHAGWDAARTLIDKDELYAGRLGVSLHPSIGIADDALQLLAYEPYSQINYRQRIEAQLDYALGDLNLEQLRAALDPPVLPKKHRNRAQLNFHYALTLYDRGKLDRSLETAELAVRLDAGLADAYALIGLIYLRKNDCARARQQFTMALSRDPGNVAAKQGQQICR